MTQRRYVAQGGRPSLRSPLLLRPADALELLEHNGEVLNLRSGSRWDLFFPGYFQTSRTNESIFLPGCMPVGRGFLSNWYFNAKDFDRMCKQVETMSQGQFIYDGRPTIMGGSGHIRR